MAEFKIDEINRVWGVLLERASANSIGIDPIGMFIAHRGDEYSRHCEDFYNLTCYFFYRSNPLSSKLMLAESDLEKIQGLEHQSAESICWTRRMDGPEAAQHKALLLEKLVEACQQDDIMISGNLFSRNAFLREPHLLLKKGTTLEELLIESALAAW